MLLSLFLTCIPLSYAQNAKTSLDILVMGDWGGQPNNPYTTPDEVDSAKIMGEIGATIAVDQIWGLGDNFYDNGVKNEYDPRFEETFEKIFTANSIKTIPYYFCAGNHDHYGNVTGEVMYSNHSERWNFPSLFYTKIFKIPGTSATLQLVMIDTVDLVGISYDREYCDKYDIDPCLIHPLGPNDLNVAQTRYAWINSTLASSTANWLIVAGHYPVWSIAEHGSTALLVKQLQPMLSEYKVTAYMSGHDHTFEYISTDDGVGYIDTGGTHVCDSSTAHQHTIPPDSLKFHGCSDGGFTRINVNATDMMVQYYYGKSVDVQYTVNYKPRM